MVNLYEGWYGKQDTLVPDEYNELLNVESVMSILGIGKNAAYNLFRTGEIKAFQLSGKWRVSKEAVNAFIKQQENKNSV